jgi:hypothetical protein
VDWRTRTRVSPQSKIDLVASLNFPSLLARGELTYYPPPAHQIVVTPQLFVNTARVREMSYDHRAAHASAPPRA